MPTLESKQTQGELNPLLHGKATLLFSIHLIFYSKVIHFSQVSSELKERRLGIIDIYQQYTQRHRVESSRSRKAITIMFHFIHKMILHSNYNVE